MSGLNTFLDTHRCDKGAKDWNLTGLLSGCDTGKYKVNDDEYDTFLRIVHNHIFGKPARASGLLERHREQGPPLVDLDFRYHNGGPLQRQYTRDDIKKFIATYCAAMIYFSRIEDLKEDPVFWHLEKPGPETDKTQHKDGVHIQCHNLTTLPRFQFGIRGFLLQNDVIGRVFGNHNISNPHEDVYDVSVIQRNNWFLYGACKPDKARYKTVIGYRLPIEDVIESLDNGDPDNFLELIDIIYDLLVETTPLKDTFETMKMLSIRRNHTTLTPLTIRSLRAAEWEELMITWGSGKAKHDNQYNEQCEITNIQTNQENQLVVTDTEEHAKVTNNTAEDVVLAYRFCRECINPERRLSEYNDWVNFAICLKNISNTEDSFKVWTELTRSVDPSHKKAHYTESELQKKWQLIRIDESRKLGMASLNYWAREDNEPKYRSILSETHTKWIVNFGKDTHVSVASFVCRYFKHEFRCSYGSRRTGEWYQYGKGMHSWKHLKTPTIIRSSLSENILREYWEAEKKVTDTWHDAADTGTKDALDAKKKKISSIQRQLETTTFKDHVLKECGEKFYDEDFIGKLNANPYLVGVANGVLELRNLSDGEQHVLFRPGLPEDYISFQMGHTEPALEAIPYEQYDPNNPTPQHIAVLEFFTRIYPDSVLREYVLTLMASCLEGDNREQKFYVMQGVGSNGKSMTEQLMEITFGDYSASISTATFTRKRPDAGNANPDLITVKCRRYLHCGEPDDNEKINTSIMKAWTGGDLIKARGLFSEQESFKIMGKIFMSCNDLPPIMKMDEGTWRRIRVIPHVSIFKDSGNSMIDPSKHIYEKDLSLEHKLRTWRVAFLGILVYYYEHKYLRGGLTEPACVTAASDKYKEEFDLFMQFVNETFVIEPDAGSVLVKDFKLEFAKWTKSLGKVCEIKPKQAEERMRKLMKTGANEKEFWGIRLALDGEDISGAPL
jgi:P4 family phage/plasmid primase-like protien